MAAPHPATNESVLNDVQRQAVEAGVSLDALPQHVAIIMDGNGRWATSRGLPRLLGHREGYRSLRTVIKDADDLGLKYLTVYAFSAENWRRPDDEVEGLMKLIEKATRDELRVMHQNNVKVRAAGRIHEVPESLRQALEDGIETTKDNTGLVFTLAVNYGGRAEIVDAVRALVQEGATPEAITEDALRAHLYNSDIPDPDLMIRTASEMRWSNFLIWQSAYAELAVTEATWPEFRLEHMIEAIKQFQSRKRKFGGLGV